jgi:iron complex outermembrane receptor protein
MDLQPRSAWTLRQHICLILSAGLFAMAAQPLYAQDADEPEQASEEAQDDEVVDLGDILIVTTGTRVEGRTPTESVSPIDIFNGEDLARQASADLTDQLRNISPSFNTQRFPIADGTAFIRPANLRNLPPDQTLVLVNGRRRHRSALVNLQVDPLGTVNQGSQAVDFGLIPSAAIERVEVLRDGSSAQYGSDAIAGVINVILKDNPEGITFTGQYGSTYDGDGDNYRFSTNFGVPLGAEGFLNATAEYINSDFTSRGSARPDAAAVGAAVGFENVPFEGLGQRWGDPNVDGFRLFFNTEVPINDDVAAYGHGSYADQEYDSSFFYRTPVGVDGVDPRATLLVDSDGDGLPDPVEQSIIDDIIARGLNPSDFVTADPNSPSGFVALNPIASQFPGGYTPTFGADVKDYEGVLGLRGELGNGLRWDLSGRFGENEITYNLDDSINPGLGINSPTSFRPGVLEQREIGINGDFVLPIYVDGLASPLNLAFGGEYRRETYEIGTGDPASFELGPTGILFGVGSDGFQGDAPDAAGEFSRDSYAGYIDLETDVNEWLTLAAAGRFEDLEGFDSNFDWKFSARAQVTDNLAFRATVNTGFRAPTPGQINTTDLTTTASADGTLVPLGTFGVNTAAAQALGAQPLETEDSFNISAGIVFEPIDDLTFTVDYYNIDIDDRIALANFTIDPGSPEQQALIDAGVPGANLIGSASFFTNAFDTTVQGVDIVANYQYDLGSNGYVIFDARHSYNDQEVDSFVEGTIDGERVFDLENQLPNHRSILTVDYRSPWNIDVLVRANRYGEWADASFGERATFSSQWLFDLVVTYHFENFRITAGAENIFDNFPDAETNGTLRFLGATRPISSPFGFNGGSWFVRASMDIF